jgi:hypothetical protein
MANMIIKPAADGNLLIQDRAGGAVLSTSTSGATIASNVTGIPAAGVTGVLPVGVTGGSGLNALSASNLSAGTVPDARFPATLPAIDGSALTGAVAFYASNGPSQNSTVIYTVNFGTVVLDTHSAGSATRFTTPIQGKYLCSYGWMINSSASNRSCLHKNGVLYGTNIYVSGHTYARMANTVALTLNVGDYLEVKNNVSGGAEGNRHGGYDYFTVVKV